MLLGQARLSCRTLVPAILVAALAIPATSPADDWDTTRKTLIDPLNSALHSHWPEQLEKRELDVLLRLYATPTGTGLRWGDVETVPSSPQETMLRWSGPGVARSRSASATRSCWGFSPTSTKPNCGSAASTGAIPGRSATAPQCT